MIKLNQKRHEEIDAIAHVVAHKFFQYSNMAGVSKEDLVQVAWDRYLKLREKYPNSEPPDNELYSTFRYYMDAYIKKQKPKNVIFISDDILELDWVPETLDDPATYCETRDSVNKVKKGLHNLTERQRYVICSAYLGDTTKSIEELAKELKITRQRVYAIIREAQRKLGEYVNR